MGAKIIRGTNTAFRIDVFDNDILLYVCSPLPKHKYAPIVTSKNVVALITFNKTDLINVINVCKIWKDNILTARNVNKIFDHLIIK